MPSRWLPITLLAWVLWMDQTTYSLPSGPNDRTPLRMEGATGRFQELAVTSTRGQCEALRQARIRDAIQADAEQDRAPGGPRPRYRDQYRFFCSPVVDDPAP